MLIWTKVFNDFFRIGNRQLVAGVDSEIVFRIGNWQLVAGCRFDLAF